MTSRARRLVLTIGTLVVLQALAILAYVYATKKPVRSAEFRFESLEARIAPPFEVEASDGTLRTVGDPGDRPVLVHFWASWCEPCRKELPGLLARAAANERKLLFVAVAVEDTWPDIGAFFDGGKIPVEIVRAANPDGPRRWGADALPDTYLVDRRGYFVERYLGARDWRSESGGAHLARSLERLSQ